MTTESLIIIIVALLIFVILFGVVRAADKVTLNRKKKELDKMKDDFISTVSHELRTPLTVIRGYIEIIRGEDTISRAGRKNIEKIDDASEHLDHLIGDMADASKLENKSMKFNFSVIDPVLVAHRVVNDFAVLAKHKGLNLSLKVISTANINVDPVRLKQILRRIVSNGIKYTDNDSVTVKINIEGSDLLIIVSDTGLGISEENQEKIFDKFYKSDNKLNLPTGRQVKGTGLGLWISKQMVKRMRGKISVKSKEGVGSHFILRFPIVA